MNIILGRDSDSTTVCASSNSRLTPKSSWLWALKSLEPRFVRYIIIWQLQFTTSGLHRTSSIHFRPGIRYSQSTYRGREGFDFDAPHR